MAVAAYLILYNCNLLTISSRSGGGVGIKIFAIMLICNMIMCEKVEFRPFDPKRGREGGIEPRKNICQGMGVSGCMFDLIHYVPSTIFQLCRDRSSWVEPVLS